MSLFFCIMNSVFCLLYYAFSIILLFFMSAIIFADGVIFCMEYISLNNFETGPSKEHPRQVSSTVA